MSERGKGVGRRSGLTRFELVVTVFMVALAVAGMAALVPLTSDDGSPAAASRANEVLRLNDAELAGPRAEAALPPCPQAAAPAPADVRPAAAGPAAPPAAPQAGPAASPAGPAAPPAGPPAPPAGADAPPAGPDAPLSGVEVPCLGAPGTVPLGTALAGRETLLNVWASWCVPCKEELPALQAYAARPDAVPVLGVNVRDNPVTALKLLAQLEIRLPMVVDSGGELTGKLRTIALPASFLLRPDGGVTQLLPQVAYTEASDVADAVVAARAKAGE